MVTDAERIPGSFKAEPIIATYPRLRPVRSRMVERVFWKVDIKGKSMVLAHRMRKLMVDLSDWNRIAIAKELSKEFQHGLRCWFRLVQHMAIPELFLALTQLP